MSAVIYFLINASYANEKNKLDVDWSVCNICLANWWHIDEIKASDE